MQPYPAVFLIVLVWASCCPAGTKAADSDSFDINHELANAEEIAHNVADCLTDAAQNITEMYRNLPADTSKRVMELIMPYIINVLKTMSPSLFFPFDMLNTVPPEMILKAGSLLASMVPEMRNVIDMLSEQMKGAGETAVSAGSSGMLQSLMRTRRDSTSILSPIYNMFSSAMDRMTGLPMSTVDGLLGEGFDAMCKTGILMYNTIWGTTSQFNCDYYSTMLKNDPSQFVSAMMMLVINNMSGAFMDAMMSVLEDVWDFCKATLLPMLYNQLNSMKDAGELPESIASLVSTFDVAYDTMKMLGML